MDLPLSDAMTATHPFQFTAAQASVLLEKRQLSAEELLRSCLDRIDRRDAVVRAWLHLDRDLALRNARELDKLPRASAIHGLPWGVKDVFDTKDMPTTHNSPIYTGLRQGRDAAAVAIARACGALIMGKTDTVEFASGGRKALTTNPHNRAHTPGGSSSGSGAAVADFQAPLAFGTQTGGSLVRPAAFNGIYGLKPSWSAVSREGLKMASPTLDTVGWYGRSVEDLILVAEAFRLIRAAEMSPLPPRGLRIGLCRSPVWHAIEPAGEAALLLAARRLEDAGASVEELTLPAPFDGLAAAHADIFYLEGRTSFQPELLGSPHLFDSDLKAKAENARGLAADRLLAAYTVADRCRPLFDALFGPSLDVVLTPSAPGEAPLGLQTTGNPVFNSNWTLLHVPCVAIPVGRGPNNLPVGVTLVGPRLGEARLLSIARSLAPVIDADPAANLRDLCVGS